VFSAHPLRSDLLSAHPLRSDLLSADLLSADLLSADLLTATGVAPDSLWCPISRSRTTDLKERARIRGDVGHISGHQQHGFLEMGCSTP